ncbi:hypothetical protein KCU77_g103, partial [Aureobasidium melanogenum]
LRKCGLRAPTLLKFLFSSSDLLSSSLVSCFIILQTMAERAGLVLGAIPLILFALDKYQECLEFGRSYAKYKDTLMSIRDEVSIQQFLFHDTIKKMGLDKPTYAELKECLQTNFPENHMQFMGYIRKMADTTDELMDKLEVETNKQTGDISSHVGWEWRRVKRHFSSKERKRIFDKLQHSNNKFRAILTESGVPLEESSPDIESFHLTELSYRTSSSSLTDLSCHAVSRADDALAAKGIEVNHKKDAMGDRNRASKLGPEEHRLGPRISDQFTWRSRLPKNERPTIVYADDVHETHAMMLLRSSNFGEHTRSLRQKGTVFCATVPEPGCANLSRHPGETSHKAGIGRAIEGNQRQGEKLLQDHEVICHTLPDTDNVDQEHGQHASLSERGQSRSPSDMDSVASSEESMVDLDNPPLTLEVSSTSADTCNID